MQCESWNNLSRRAVNMHEPSAVAYERFPKIVHRITNALYPLYISCYSKTKNLARAEM